MSLRFLCQNCGAISIDIAKYGWFRFLVQEVDAARPETKIDDIPFKLDVQRSKIKINLLKSANL